MGCEGGEGLRGEGNDKGMMGKCERMRVVRGRD